MNSLQLQRLNLERVCFALASGISGDKDIEYLLSVFQTKVFSNNSNHDYFIYQLLPAFEKNYNKIHVKQEKLEEIQKEIKVYLIKTCIQYVSSVDLLKNNQRECTKFQSCFNILQTMTNKQSKYGERLLKQINNDNNDVIKDRDIKNTNNNGDDEIIYNDDDYNF